MKIYRDNELDDLRFNDRDVKKILKSAVKREKKRCSEISKKEKFRYSTIDTDYDSAATYQDLMKVTEERGLDSNIVREIVKNQDYKARNRFYEVLKDNVIQFSGAGIAGLLVGVGAKYLGDSEMINPVLYGAAITPAVDLIEFTMVKERKGNIKKTVQNDVGTFAGGTLGYALAFLL